jgi:hypothetical protein
MEVNTEPREDCGGSSVTMKPKEVETFCIKEDLTLSGLASEIDFTDQCEASYFFQFMQWDSGTPHSDNMEGFRKAILVWARGRSVAWSWLLDRGLAYMKKPYRPIFITLETLDQAQAMWHRLNCADEKFSEAYKPRGIVYVASSQNQLRTIWDKIDNALIERGTSCR